MFSVKVECESTKTMLQKNIFASKSVFALWQSIQSFFDEFVKDSSKFFSDFLTRKYPLEENSGNKDQQAYNKRPKQPERPIKLRRPTTLCKEDNLQLVLSNGTGKDASSPLKVSTLLKGDKDPRGNVSH